jgi:hypothetical protein
MITAWLAGSEVPLQPSRNQAREWAIEELSRREYQEARPSLISRFLIWLWEHVNGWQGPHSPAASVGAVIALAVFALVVIWAVRRSGGLYRNARRQVGDAMEGRPLIAAEHYGAADRAAAAGDWNTAVVERFRGIIRELEERTILNPRSGRTADEIAAEAARAVPALDRQFVRAARVFDDVRYGGQSAEQAQDGVLRELSAQLRSIRVADLRPLTGAAR